MFDNQDVLEIEVDGVKYTFSEPPYNDYLLHCEDKKTIEREDVFQRLIKIDGLKDKEGKDVPLEEFAAYRASRGASFSTRVVSAFWILWKKRLYPQTEADLKK